MRNTPISIQLTTQALVTSADVLPAASHSLCGFWIVRPLISKSSKDWPWFCCSFAASFIFLSQWSNIISLQWLLHLSGHHGFSRYWRGSGSPYLDAVLRIIPLHPRKSLGYSSRWYFMIFLTFWRSSGERASCPSKLMMSKSLWAWPGQILMLKYVPDVDVWFGTDRNLFKTARYFLSSLSSSVELMSTVSSPYKNVGWL